MLSIISNYYTAPKRIWSSIKEHSRIDWWFWELLLYKRFVLILMSQCTGFHCFLGVPYSWSDWYRDPESCICWASLRYFLSIWKSNWHKIKSNENMCIITFFDNSRWFKRDINYQLYTSSNSILFCFFLDFFERRLFFLLADVSKSIGALYDCRFEIL